MKLNKVKAHLRVSLCETGLITFRNIRYKLLNYSLYTEVRLSIHTLSIRLVTSAPGPFPSHVIFSRVADVM